VGGLFFRTISVIRCIPCEKTSAIAMFFKKKMGDAASTEARIFRVTIKFEFAINHSIQFIATPHSL
jgi:hypothetical protein